MSHLCPGTLAADGYFAIDGLTTGRVGFMEVIRMVYDYDIVPIFAACKNRNSSHCMVIIIFSFKSCRELLRLNTSLCVAPLPPSRI